MRLFHVHVVSLLVMVAVAGCVSQSSVTSKVPDQPSKPDAIFRAEIHTARAAEYYRLGRMGPALEAAEMAVAANSSHAPAHNMMAVIYVELKEDDKARQAFERALKISPADSEALNNFGWFLCQRQEAARAMGYFQAALKNPLYGTPERAHYNAGICAKRTGDWVVAEAQLRMAIKKQSGYAAPVYELAELQFRRGNAQEADVLLARHNQLVPQPSAEVLMLAVRVSRALGDKSMEESYWQQLNRRFPDSPQVRELIERR